MGEKHINISIHHLEFTFQLEETQQYGNFNTNNVKICLCYKKKSGYMGLKGLTTKTRKFLVKSQKIW